MNPVLSLLLCLAAFTGLILGLGLPWVATWRVAPAERLCAAALAGVVALYLFALADYGLNLPPWARLLVPLAALAGAGLRWRAAAAVLRAPDARRLFGAWLLVAGWTLGFLALVRNYSGGCWALDWADHYSRALLFLHHQPVHTPLFGGDQLPARPPLANAATAVLLGLTRSDYAFFQIFTALLGTLAFLPVWLFAGAFARNARRAQAVVTVLFMLNPSVLENSSFAWTKLPTVAFALAGLYFFLPARAAGSGRRLAAAFAFLAAGVLVHYSAGPYVVAVVAAYFWCRRRHWRRTAFWRDTVLSALPAALLLATWFGWAWIAFGPRGTLLSNTSVVETTAHSWAGFMHEKDLNLLHTLIPHFLRPVDYGFIAQASRPGWLRDWFFLLYQVNLPWMLGSAGGMTLLWLLGSGWRGAGAGRAFWAWFIGCTIVLGTAAYGGIDAWGVGHLCLQGLVGLGLALLAARFNGLPRWWQGLLAFGWSIDAVLGIGLQFYLEHVAQPPLEVVHATATGPAGGGPAGTVLPHLDYNAVQTTQWGTWVNLWTKVRNGYEFVGDWAIPLPLLLGLLACLLGLAVHRCFDQASAAPPPGDSAAAR